MHNHKTTTRRTWSTKFYTSDELHNISLLLQRILISLKPASHLDSLGPCWQTLELNPGAKKSSERGILFHFCALYYVDNYCNIADGRVRMLLFIFFVHSCLFYKILSIPVLSTIPYLRRFQTRYPYQSGLLWRHCVREVPDKIIFSCNSKQI